MNPARPNILCPNILYVHSHDTGRYLQPYGYAVRTPQLQRLAEEGVLFTRAFAAAPTCSPSRAALLTGESPHNSGMMGLAHRGWRLNDPSRHLAHVLKNAGYHTALAGVQHLAPDPAELGYRAVLKTKSNHAKDVAGAAERFLGRPQRKPFFLDVGFVETHLLPYGDSSFAHARGDPRYVRPLPPLPDTPETRQDVADFGVAVGVVDEAALRVLGALEHHGLAETTLVIYTTDHGPPLPGMKGTLTDHGLGVSLIMRGPGFSGGQVLTPPVSQLDVFPTLCELAGLAPPTWLQGRSLLPLLRGDADLHPKLHDAIFGETTHHVAYEPQRSVRTEGYRYVRQFSTRGRPVPSNTDDSASKALWLARGWLEQPVPQERLFDLTFDPGEAHNVAAEPKYRETLTAARQLLQSWMEETDDPLLSGDVLVPPGTRTKDPDALSPSD